MRFFILYEKCKDVGMKIILILTILLTAIAQVQSSEVADEILELKRRNRDLQLLLTEEQERVALRNEMIKMQRRIIEQDRKIKEDLYAACVKKGQHEQEYLNVIEQYRRLINHIKSCNK